MTNLNLTTIEEIENAMSEQLASEGIVAEVTIRNNVMIYLEGEALENETKLVEIMNATGRDYEGVSRYEAEQIDDEFLPAGATFSWAM